MKLSLYKSLVLSLFLFFWILWTIKLRLDIRKKKLYLFELISLTFLAIQNLSNFAD